MPSFQCYVTCICCFYVLYVFHWLEIHIIGLHGTAVPYVWTLFYHPWFKSQLSIPSRFTQLQLWSSCSLFFLYGPIHSWRHHNYDILCCIWHILWYFIASWALLQSYQGASSNWEEDSWFYSWYGSYTRQYQFKF